MRNFFRSLTRRRVEYLLISGQATVLYGAAQFSEDVDLWVNPTRINLARLAAALSDLRARVHKLTPPMTPRNARRGHGFHFIVPGPIYLDVMGRPPRVAGFGAAMRRCRRIRSDWGVLPVAAPEEIISLKRTRRLADYDVISRMVRLRIEEEEKPGRRLLAWGLTHSFSAPDIAWMSGLPSSPRIERPAARAGTQDSCLRRLAKEIAEHQRADLMYWSPIIQELRELRRAGELLPEGSRCRIPTS